MPPHPRESERRARLVNRFRTEVPPRPDPEAAPKPPTGLRVFAVGVDRAQLTWKSLGPGPMRISCGPSSWTATADGGPGAATIDGLPPGAPITIAVSGPGVIEPVVLETVTLPRPDGELLHRFATVSDMHVGSSSTGYLHTMVEIPTPLEAAPVRCFRAALDEAVAWGARDLILKGDIVEASRPEHWASVATIISGTSTPVLAITGNHEWNDEGSIDPRVGATTAGFEFARDVDAVDRDGLRIVLGETTLPGHDHGRLDHADALIEAAGGADRPVFLALHHQLTRARIPTYLPPGILAPSSFSFLDALGVASPATLVSSGHTHRHRRWEAGTVTITEVGSTKDFPGTWAGYEVYEGGIVQTVWRIAEPSCIRWTDYSRRAALGVWGWWAPGTLADRCFTKRWEHPSGAG